MRWIGVLFFAASLMGTVQAQAAGGRSTRMIYLLRDESRGTWCGYASEAQFRAEAESLGAAVVGGATYTDGRLSRVEVTVTDETGDWEVYDDYLIPLKKRSWRLSRTVSIIPEDLREKHLFVMNAGKAVEQQASYTELGTGRPTDRRAEWFESPPIFTDRRQFPFWLLISDKRQAIWADGRVCTADRSR